MPSVILKTKHFFHYTANTICGFSFSTLLLSNPVPSYLTAFPQSHLIHVYSFLSLLGAWYGLWSKKKKKNSDLFESFFCMQKLLQCSHPTAISSTLHLSSLTHLFLVNRGSNSAARPSSLAKSLYYSHMQEHTPFPTQLKWPTGEDWLTSQKLSPFQCLGGLVIDHGIEIWMLSLNVVKFIHLISVCVLTSNIWSG